MNAEQEPTATAAKVVVSYPPDLGESGPEFLEKESFKRYLRRAWDELEPGAEIEEMVNLGCCSDAMHAPFTIESVEGGTRMGPDTEVFFVPGDEPAGLGCDW